MKSFLLFLFFILLLNLNAQTDAPALAGAKGAALGNASVTFSDINSAFSNQAGLAFLQNVSFTAVAEQRFLISELQSISAAAALPTASGVWGLTVNYFGFETFNQQKIGLAYARKLFDNLSIGAQLLMLNTNIQEYGNKTNLTFELGMISQLLPELRLGVHAYSPARVRLSEEDILPTVFKIGLAYLPSSRVVCTAEVEKDIDFPVRTKFGAEYQLIEQLHLRVGLATRPTNYSFGIGYGFSNGLSLDIASVHHQYLGFTPAISISYQRKKR